MNTTGASISAWTDAALAASLFAVAPLGSGGVVVRALPGPVRDRWWTLVRQRLPAMAPVRRIPLNVTDDRLLGGLDLAATLSAGRVLAQRGILADADGGIVVLAMAERLPASTAARLAAVLDSGEVALERDGIALRSPARIGVVAFDESMGDDERPPAALFDRLAFHVDLSDIRLQDTSAPTYSPAEIDAARLRLPSVHSNDAVIQALCATALALGIASLRAVLFALCVARAASALAGRSMVTEADAALAGRLVFARRATALPAIEPPREEDGAYAPAIDQPHENAINGMPPAAANSLSNDQHQEDAEGRIEALDEVVLAATQSAIPAGLLAQLKSSASNNSRRQSSGKAGALQNAKLRGRPAGVRRGEPRAGLRLNVLETLRAAAPWQRLRRSEVGAARSDAAVEALRIQIRGEDFRVTRYKQRSETSTIFVVDASGSSALHRLAEAKGAVELLLADCYVRRDRVAVIAFRGKGAELVLPPTRSLVRAKRSLAGLPGGGATPLAAGIDAAAALADTVRRRGGTPTLVLLTDGGANVARGTAAGRAESAQEALLAARRVRVAGFITLLVDTSPRPQLFAKALAVEMGGFYRPLPYADAATLSEAVRRASRAPK